jgi:hypothetical protein
MKYYVTVSLVLFLLGCGDSKSRNDIGGGNTPPFSGTIFITPDIIEDSDPTSYLGLTYTGQAVRSMYDRRKNNSEKYNAHLFIAAFDDGIEMEIQVNPEFDQASALIQAETYSRVIGQLPYTLRKHINYVFMHKGNYDFSGDDDGSDGWLLIHTQRGEEYIAEKILAETLVHEAVHAVFDKVHADKAQWKQAQEQDIALYQLMQKKIIPEKI